MMFVPRHKMILPGWIGLLLLCSAPTLAACKKKADSEAPQIRPVRTVIATPSELGETVMLRRWCGIRA
jgi:hypothetical protein